MMKKALRYGRFWLVAVVVVAASVFANSALLERVDLLFYDYFVNWQENRLHDEVVVVAIDDASLQTLGRWPWSRRTHAELLERLTDMDARAVGFDVLFVEPERVDATADRRFAMAIARNGNTVLALAPSNPIGNEPIKELLPISLLAKPAAAMGHVDVELDRDGLCRSFYLNAGLGDSHWPAFARAVMLAGGKRDVPALPTAGESAPGTGSGWLRSNRFFIPFDPRPDALQIVSFAAVLDGSVAEERIRDKYVLVGSTATGLGDMVSTPISVNHQRMPGVEINAHILSGLLHGNLARALDNWSYLALTIIFTGLAALAIVLAGFTSGVLLFFIAIGSILAISALLLMGWHLWFAPAASIVPLVGAFPLWVGWSLLLERQVNRSLTVRMQHQALHHTVTDLPNQYILEEHLRELDEQPHTGSDTRVLIILHLKWPAPDDHTVERSSSDEILRAIAERLRGSVRSNDLVVHLKGDDFGILVQNFSDREDGLRIAEDLCMALQSPLMSGDTPLFLTPRIGLSFWPEESRDGSALLRDAYIAMYHARIEESSKPFVYSQEIAQQIHARSKLEQALISATDRGEFEVYYQPQVVTGSNRIIGVEALLRWHNPDLGLVYPGTFIPVAEHMGLIQEIGAWVLRSACKQVRQWSDEGLGPLRLAVNLSPLQFTDANLVEDVVAALQESGLSAAQLELEITESTLMQNIDAVTSAMRMLKALGVKLALDDFGTGYSSLSNLQHFPLDRLKIDQSFTRELTSKSGVREITTTIVAMAKRLNLEVIAEGVETPSQADFLIRHGCNELQGYLFSRPLPAREIRQLLDMRKSAPRAGGL